MPKETDAVGNDDGTVENGPAWLKSVRWAATACGIAAAVMVSSNTAATKWGFVVFTAASILWIVAGLNDRLASLATLNAVLLVVNLVGIWRWFGF
jgi:hypothetical protein